MMRAMGVVALLMGAGVAWAVVPPTEDPLDIAVDVPERAGLLSAEDAERVATSQGFQRPTWRVGTSYGIEFSGGGSCEYAVTEAAAESVLVAPACSDLALEQALFLFPWFGRLSRDLASTDEGAPTAFFQWPLVDGASWETSWRTGQDDSVDGVLVQADFAPEVDGPAGTEPGFVLVASFDGDSFARWNYVPSIGWWSRFEYLVEDGFWFAVTDHTEGWTGTTYEALVTCTSIQNGQVHVGSTFDVRSTDDYVVTLLDYEGVLAGRPMFMTPDGVEPGPDLSGAGTGAEWWVIESPAAGQWTYEWAGLAVAGRGLSARIHCIDFVEHVVGAPEEP